MWSICSMGHKAPERQAIVIGAAPATECGGLRPVERIPGNGLFQVPQHAYWHYAEQLGSIDEWGAVIERRNAFLALSGLGREWLGLMILRLTA